MSENSQAKFIAAIGLAMMLGIGGCHKNNPEQNPNTGATQVADDSQDPAMQANLAPVSATTAAPESEAQSSAPAAGANPPAPPPDNTSAAPPPADNTAENQANDSYDYNAVDTTQQDQSEPVEYATAAPPPLPEYDQPECPGDNYIWTPGYWGYASAGYYWVPGVWVIAPYIGSLWTPGYWGFYNNRYWWHHGYWGPHIGFYGGVNYGYGYVGTGYVGGYWNNGAFMYNRSVTRVNTTIVHNVYAHNVTIINNTRVSYNGGRGGLAVRPTGRELYAARYEPHSAPLPEQLQHARQMATNRQQFYSVNHGRPAVTAVARPLETTRRAPAPMPTAVRERVQTEALARPTPIARPNEARPTEARPTATRPGETRPTSGARPETGRPEARPTPARTQPEARPESRPESRPQTQRPEARPQEQRPQQQRPQEQRPAAARPESREQPARPEAQPRPAAAPRPESRPESRPQPQEHPQQSHPEERRPQ